ncbi:MAG TPA: 16S rRNA (guanine(527)-N(7))-methyltransferase RsmG [Porphyromonadaceae bacterium]|nr:16S rRNA (guanine(527)-N(7))-methyltransferase RsmG [Porphyromonadaceae bacterium]
MELLRRYFTDFTSSQWEQFEKLGPLYRDWNEKINVISRKDIDNLYERHILHSLSIAKLLTFQNGTRIVDIGTGGGFPAIPLAIAFPNCTFFLVERTGKKLHVAEEIAHSIGLVNVSFFHGDITEVKEKFDFAVSRGVMPLPELYKSVKKNIVPNGENALPNGVICLKGGELAQEVSCFGKRAEVIDIKTFFNEEFFMTKKIVYVYM